MKTRTKSVVRMLFLYFAAFGIWIVTLFVLKIDKLWALIAGIGLLIVGLVILAAAILEAQKIRATQPPR
jgi:energy-converting hydrogenase Eha subunit E